MSDEVFEKVKTALDTLRAEEAEAGSVLARTLKVIAQQHAPIGSEWTVKSGLYTPCGLFETSDCRVIDINEDGAVVLYNPTELLVERRELKELFHKWTRLK